LLEANPRPTTIRPADHVRPVAAWRLR
jgi:hypothetical protein